jgi:hypothetical protein
MTRRTHLHRALVATLAASAFLALGQAPAASAGTMVPERICDHDWREGTRHIRLLIKCAARQWDSPGTPRRAVAVARCESDLRPNAYNPNGYAGLFQQATRYWPDRAAYWGQPNRSVFNGRANVIVSIRMAADAGTWRAWAGCG